MAGPGYNVEKVGGPLKFRTSLVEGRPSGSGYSEIAGAVQFK